MSSAPAARRADHLRAISVLTLVLVLVSALRTWYTAPLLVSLCLLGLVRAWHASFAFWFALASLLGLTVLRLWSSADNHQYLIAYWCLALALSCRLPETARRAALASSARLLLGLTMLFATLWKAFSSTYLTGEFFLYTLLTDGRFEQFTSRLTGVSLAELDRNRDLVSLLREGHFAGADVTTVNLASAPAVSHLATAATWSTIAIEGAIAGFFLWPRARRVGIPGHLLLLAFIGTTYFVAPVQGFGWILVILGYSQCAGRTRRLRPLYLLALVLVQIYTVSFARVFEKLSALLS